MNSLSTKVQTGIRLDLDLYNRLKVRAKQENRSFNNYVETILESSLGVVYPKFGEGLVVSDKILALGETLPHYSAEEISADERLAYLLSK